MAGPDRYEQRIHNRCADSEQQRHNDLYRSYPEHHVLLPIPRTNGVGTGAWSSTSSAKTITGKPSAPGNLTIEPEGGTKLRLRWTAPADTGGSPLTQYAVAYHTDEGGGIIAYVPAGTLTWVGDRTDDSWTYDVAAENVNGTGPYSSRVSLSGVRTGYIKTSMGGSIVARPVKVYLSGSWVYKKLKVYVGGEWVTTK